MKTLIKILFIFVLFSSCDSSYVLKEKKDIKIGEYEQMMSGDTCLVHTDMEDGKTFIHNLQNETYYKSYSASFDNTSLLVLIIVCLLVGLLIGSSIRY